jgi:hypothetical protein
VSLFAFASVFLSGLLVIALVDKNPSQTSWHIYNCVLAMAAGGFAALLPGSVSLKLPPGTKAGGAIAITVLIFYVGKNFGSPEARVQDLQSFLMFSPNAVAANPNTSDVYVVVNWKVVEKSSL